MPLFALDLEYDGRAFRGTQAQAPGARTLHAVLSVALADIGGASPPIRMSSRLDAQVSAEHLPCDVRLEREWNPAVLVSALNARLPSDVAILRAAVVDDAWHVQHAVSRKTYRYSVLVRATRPVLNLRSTWVRRLDQPEILPSLAAHLIGTKDLSGFASLRHDDSDDDDPVRRIDTAAWTTTEHASGLLLEFTVGGQGFLYKQIRGMVGAMLHVAKGRCDESTFVRTVTLGRAAARIGNVAPAHGLVLANVAFHREPTWMSPP